MRVVNLIQLATMPFSVSGVKAYRQHKTCGTYRVRHRPCNGFLYFEKGSCRYRWDGGSSMIHPGAILYLPFESMHQFEVLTEEISFIRIDFTLQDEVGGRLIFNDSPMLITQQTSSYCQDRIQKLNACFLEKANNFKSVSYLCSLLAELSAEVQAGTSKISPAIQTIHANLLKPLDAESLAELCGLSQSQMYRLFKEETGTSPVEYRNRLRVEKACILLREKEFTVGEIADMLGFESIFYFSRVFKKQKGVSPSRYEG